MLYHVMAISTWLAACWRISKTLILFTLYQLWFCIFYIINIHFFNTYQVCLNILDISSYNIQVKIKKFTSIYLLIRNGIINHSNKNTAFIYGIDHLSYAKKASGKALRYQLPHWLIIKMSVRFSGGSEI